MFINTSKKNHKQYISFITISIYPKIQCILVNPIYLQMVLDLSLRKASLSKIQTITILLMIIITLLINHNVIMPSSAAILKARKILGFFQEPQPRKYCAQPIKSSAQKSKSKHSQSYTSSKSISNSKDFSFCKNNQLNRSSIGNLSLKNKNQNNSSFISTYGKETRYQKIMKLKVKPINKLTSSQQKVKKDLLSRSFSSSSSFKQQGKQNRNKNKISRLEKIMQIKVNKPLVPSTIQTYQPPHANKSIKKQTRQSAIKQWKQCNSKIKKVKQQQQKQDRLWKVFQRQRQLRVKLKKNSQQRQSKEQRRKQVRFQRMVSKQVQKIQKQRQISKRKREGFSKYVYPSY